MQTKKAPLIFDTETTGLYSAQFGPEDPRQRLPQREESAALRRHAERCHGRALAPGREPHLNLAFTQLPEELHQRNPHRTDLRARAAQGGRVQKRVSRLHSLKEGREDDSHGAGVR